MLGRMFIFVGVYICMSIITMIMGMYVDAMIDSCEHHISTMDYFVVGLMWIITFPLFIVIFFAIKVKQTIKMIRRILH